MDDNNSSLKSTEELLYLPPNYTVQQKGQQIIKEKGFFPAFGAVFWPAFKENPFPFIGMTMIVGAISTSFYYELRNKRDKAFDLLKIKSKVEVFTVAAIGGGLYYREYKARKRAAEAEKVEPGNEGLETKSGD